MNHSFRHSSMGVGCPQRRELLRPPRLLHRCRRVLREASAPGDQLTVRRRISAGGPTVRAVVISEPGGLEVLGVADRPVRDAGPGEIRIAVKAAGVNPTDIGLRERGAGDDPTPPWVPGTDAGGAVESVGDGVDRVGVGDEVMAAVSPRRPEGGAQAELVVVPAASVVPLPHGATLQQASTLPMNGLTARLGLELFGLEAGQTLAVSGGAGLLASYVIPLAKVRGLRVIADAQPADQELVRSFGADVVVLSLIHISEP